MTKRELIDSLEPFDDDTVIVIFKNGTVHPANSYYSSYYGKEACIIIHNLKPIEIKTVQVNR
jgi:hypothetical protein